VADPCIEGGANNLLYRATCATDDLAIKFCIRDERENRAGREFASLMALQERGWTLRPSRFYWIGERYSSLWSFQTWLEGTILTEPPEAEAIGGIAGVLHRPDTVTPDRTPHRFPPARSSNMKNTRRRRQRQIRKQRRCSGGDVSRRRSSAWYRGSRRKRTRSGRKPPSSLHCGFPTVFNFLRREGVWAAVDWDYSGWG